MEEAGRLAGVDVTQAWLEDSGDVLRIRLEQLLEEPQSRPWLLRLIVVRETGCLVGYVNFHEPPGRDRRVEIGYSILAPYRRRGYALEAAEAMFDWAAQRSVVRFRASVSPGNAPSLGMIARMGFRRVGVQWDEIDGRELVFEASYDEIRKTLARPASAVARQATCLRRATSAFTSPPINRARLNR